MHDGWRRSGGEERGQGESEYERRGRRGRCEDLEMFDDAPIAQRTCHGKDDVVDYAHLGSLES